MYQYFSVINCSSTDLRSLTFDKHFWVIRDSQDPFPTFPLIWCLCCFPRDRAISTYNNSAKSSRRICECHESEINRMRKEQFPLKHPNDKKKLFSDLQYPTKVLVISVKFMVKSFFSVRLRRVRVQVRVSNSHHGASCKCHYV